MSRIYVDIGHGGADPGAVATTNGIKYVEYNFNVRVGNRFAERMRAFGHDVLVEPGHLSLSASAAKANEFKADYIFSFHMNAAGGDRGEVYYAKEKGSKELADAVAAALTAFGQQEVRVKYWPNSSGTAEYLGILRHSKMPGVLIEPCFIDNKSDVKLLDTEREQLAWADALAEAVDKQISDGKEYIICPHCGKRIEK